MRPSVRAPKPPVRATTKEIFELLHATAVKFRDGFVESGFKVATVQMIFMGWLLSSRSAQAFLHNAPVRLWKGCMLLGLIGTGTILLSFIRAAREIATIHRKLVGIGWVDAFYLEHCQLKPRLFWGVLLLNGSLCLLLLLAMVIVRLAPLAPPSS